MAYVCLTIGVLACSTAVLWIKQSRLDPALLTCLRLAIASIVLSPWVWRDWRRHRATLTWAHLRDAAIPGVVFALHLISWNLGVRQTLASNGTLVVTLTPIATPLLLALIGGERVTRRELAATGVAIAGIAILFGVQFRVGAETLRGDLICFGSMLLAALYLTLARRFRHHPTNVLFITPLYAVAALVAFAAAPTAIADPAIDWGREWVWLAALVALPTLLGHSMLIAAMRGLRGQVVSVVNMSQFAIAATLAWWFLGERPETAFYPAAALVLVAGGLILRPAGDAKTPPIACPDAERPAPDGVQGVVEAAAAAGAEQPPAASDAEAPRESAAAG